MKRLVLLLLTVCVIASTWTAVSTLQASPFPPCDLRGTCDCDEPNIQGFCDAGGGICVLWAICGINQNFNCALGPYMFCS